MEAPATQNLQGHRRMLGALWAVYGMIGVVKIAWLAVNAENLTLMWGALPNRVPNPYAWMSLFPVCHRGLRPVLGISSDPLRPALLPGSLDH
jgi:hypothetical protein